jgi:CYTH domain-containing protein
MTKTAQLELYRLFLIEKLPEPLTPASSHLQLFDNYLENTRLRLRKTRDPYSRTWTYVLQQQIFSVDGETSGSKLAEIHLNDPEYEVLQPFEGREIRKNRYFHEFDLAMFTFDIFLGPLFGLNTARVDFDTRESLEEFIPPPFGIIEVTADPFFRGPSLVDKRFEDIRKHVEPTTSSEFKL